MLPWELGTGFRERTTDLRYILEFKLVLTRARKGSGKTWNYEHFEIGRFGVKARIETSGSQE